MTKIVSTPIPMVYWLLALASLYTGLLVDARARERSEASTTKSTNLSGNLVVQNDMNVSSSLSPGDTSTQDMLSKTSERLLHSPIKFGDDPAFHIWNKISANPVVVHCVNDNGFHPNFIVDVVLPVGGLVMADLDVVDPNQPHVIYRCGFVGTNTSQQRLNHIVWADLAHPYLLPLPCVVCIFTLHDSGLYLYNVATGLNVLVSHWDPPNI